MEEQKPRRRQTHAYWQEQLAQCERDGQSAYDYCKKNEIHYKTFLYHKRKRFAKSAQQPAIHFVEAKVVSEHKIAQASGVLQLILPNGVRLGVPPDLDLSWLKKVLFVAGALSC
jgi:hypothetical protein